MNHGTARMPSISHACIPVERFIIRSPESRCWQNTGCRQIYSKCKCKVFLFFFLFFLSLRKTIYLLLYTYKSGGAWAQRGTLGGSEQCIIMLGFAKGNGTFNKEMICTDTHALINSLLQSCNIEIQKRKMFTTTFQYVQSQIGDRGARSRMWPNRLTAFGNHSPLSALYFGSIIKFISQQCFN